MLLRIRLGFACLLTLLGVAALRDPSAGGPIFSLDTAVHETGHLVFAPFGQVAHVLGGTLFQLIVPAVFLGYFARRRDLFGASAALWWAAMNLAEISVYVADARAQELPLIGGGEHDWTFLLEHWGVLMRDVVIARRFHASGVVLFIVASAGLFCFSRPVPIATADDNASTDADEGVRLPEHAAPSTAHIESRDGQQ